MPCCRAAISSSSTSIRSSSNASLIGLPSRRRSVGWLTTSRRKNGTRLPHRPTAMFTSVRVAAAMMPPVSELSPPVIAFWTAFAMTRITTRSKGVIWPSSRLPAKRSSTSTTI